MKRNIHPNYDKITVTCICGNQINIQSTICNNINIDVCNMCHPFYTGKQRSLDNIGRVSVFNRRFNAYYK